MPHLVILYTAQLDHETDMSALCRNLADTMLGITDEQGQQVFPTGGTRVLAYPAPHYAIADGGAAGMDVGGSGDYAFIYLNLRMGKGRTEAVQQRVGQALLAATKQQLRDVFARTHMGVTLQIDVGQEVFDAKHSTLHPLFNKN
jgi:5-carboxymethyl-2-hydroxymuconate isomerase